MVLTSFIFCSCEDIYEGGQNEVAEIDVSLKAQIVPYDREKPEDLPENSFAGVYMLSTEGETIASDEKMAIGSDGMIATDGKLKYPTNGSKVDFISYMPYQSAIANNNRISLDVSSVDKASQSDILYAESRNKYMSLSPVKLQFKHILAAAVFNISAVDGVTDEDLSSISFTFMDVTAKADFDILTTELSNVVQGNVHMSLTSGGHSGLCYFIPEQVKNLVATCSLKGMNFSKKLGQMDLKGGQLYKFDIVVSEPGFDIVLKQIEDWKVETYD